MVTTIIAAFVTLKEQIVAALGMGLTFLIVVAQNWIEARIGRKLLIPAEVIAEE